MVLLLMIYLPPPPFTYLFFINFLLLLFFYCLSFDKKSDALFSVSLKNDYKSGVRLYCLLQYA